ncbi:MAG: radical SAM protein [Deltaproteobacteria bacterium]|nr:radical SAM protein [Deltaproteobacteria bacterium]
MTRVCLVAPRIPPAAMNFAFSMPLIEKRFSHLPLPLATVAALTPPELEVAILDENVEELRPEAVDAEVVGLTGIYCQRERLFELADAFRRRGVLVAIGGPIAQDLFDDCARHADTVFVGEAEETWPRFCADLRAGRVERTYRADGWADLSRAPIPRFELLKIDRYSSGCVQATRGCPYACEYCDVPEKYGRQPRSKPVETVLEEVRRLSRLGCDSIFFVDDNFIGNRRYAKRLLEALARLLPTLGAPMYFYTQVTLNVAADDELLALFHAASFRRFFIGVETSDRAQLSALRKTHNLELELPDALRRIQSYSITVWAGIMLGLDGDDPSSFDAQYRLIEETGITPTLIGLLQAMPGAPLHARAEAEGRLLALPEVVGSGALGSLAAQGRTNLVHRGLDERALLRGFAAFVRRVYDPAAYGERLLVARGRGSRELPSPWSVLTWGNLKAFARLFAHYLRRSDAAERRMVAHVLASTLRAGGQGLDEVLFHLVIYKHLREFYTAAAEVAERASA